MEHKAYEQVKAQHENIIAINRGGGMPLTYGQDFAAIAQLLADYEALYTENEKLKRTHSRLRTSLDAVIGHATEARNELGEPEPLKLGKSAALNTQPATAPQAEWTPRKGSMVITSQTSRPISYRGLQGKVEATYEEGGILYYQVRLVTGVLCEYEAHELEG